MSESVTAETADSDISAFSEDNFLPEGSVSETGNEQPETENNSDVTESVFGIELVLNQIFDCFTLYDLLTVRLVCHHWNLFAIPYLMKLSHPISFNEDNNWTNIPNRGISDMIKLIEAVKSNSNFPIVKSDIGTSIMKEKNSHALKDFFTIVGPTLNDLTIRDDWGIRIFTTSPTWIFDMKNLNCFTLHLLQSTGINNLRLLFKLVRNILTNAPKLTSLTVIKPYSTNDFEDMDGLFSLLQSINLKNLKEFRFDAQIQDKHMLALSALDMNLLRFQMDLWGSVLEPSSFKKFLEKQSQSLCYLSITDVTMSTYLDVHFPHFPNLKILRIKGSMLGQISVNFLRVNYEEQFPRLDCLVLSQLYEWEDFLRPRINPCVTLRKLKLPCDFSDDYLLRRSASLFPNITYLKIPHFRQLLETVYEMMPKLETLVISTRYVQNVDSILTGLPSVVCSDLLKEDDLMEHLANINGRSLWASLKSITSLKNLKRFALKCKFSEVIEVTDVSCYLAFLQMKSLQRVEFGTRRHSISPKCLDQMREKFLVLF